MNYVTVIDSATRIEKVRVWFGEERIQVYDSVSKIGVEWPYCVDLEEASTIEGIKRVLTKENPQADIERWMLCSAATMPAFVRLLMEAGKPPISNEEVLPPSINVYGMRMKLLARVNKGEFY